MAITSNPTRPTSRALLAVGLVLLLAGLAVTVVSFGRTIGGLSFPTPVSIDRGDVQVSGPSGDTQPLSRPRASHHEVGGTRYTGAVGFDAPSTGDYRITVSGPATGRFILSRDLALVFHASTGKIHAIAIGGLITLAALVMACLGAAPRRWDGTS